MTGQDNIQDILQSVKIPCQPPNKSQWKKLEIAIKFINARETLEKRGKRMESMMKTKIWILLFPLFSKASLSKKSAEQKRYTLKYFLLWCRLYHLVNEPELHSPLYAGKQVWRLSLKVWIFAGRRRRKVTRGSLVIKLRKRAADGTKYRSLCIP